MCSPHTHTRKSNCCKSVHMITTFSPLLLFSKVAVLLGTEGLETKAVQLENINSANDGGTLPYTPQ